MRMEEGEKGLEVQAGLQAGDPNLCLAQAGAAAVG